MVRQIRKRRGAAMTIGKVQAFKGGRESISSSMISHHPKEPKYIRTKNTTDPSEVQVPTSKHSILT
jgi:hypothetical protein